MDAYQMLTIAHIIFVLLWVGMFIKKGGVIYLVLATLFVILICFVQMIEVLEKISNSI